MQELRSEFDARIQTLDAKIDDLRKLVIRLFAWLVGLAVTITLVVLAASWGFTSSTAQRVATLESAQQAEEQRIHGLETGLSTPMARDTRERFDSIQRQITRLSSEVGKIRAVQQRILDKLDGRR